MADDCGVVPGWANASGTFTADGAACERDCCLLLCRCWIDIQIQLELSDAARLLLLLPVAAGIALSCANMWQHYRAYALRKGGGGGVCQPLAPGDGEEKQAADAATTLYLRMRLSFIAVLTAAPVLSAVAWAQLYFGGFHAEADAIVMMYEAVAINCYLQMVLSFAGGRKAVAGLLEANGMRVLWAIPISNADASSKPCRRKCMGFCMKINCKLWTFGSSAGLLQFWEWSVLQMIPVKTALALTAVVTSHAMDDGGEAARMPINVLNVVSMIVAIRANIALYFELRDSLKGLSPVLKYMSCRAVLSCALSQRFLLDATILDPVTRFDLLNLLLCVEMPVLSVAWWFIFSPRDRVFKHITDSATAGAAGADTAAEAGVAPNDETGVVAVAGVELEVLGGEEPGA